MKEGMSDLQLTSTKDLVDELLSRFEHCVIAGMRTKVTSKEDIITLRRFHGNFTLCAGLCSELQRDILTQHARTEKSVEDF